MSDKPKRKIPLTIDHAKRAESLVRAILVWAAAIGLVLCLLSGGSTKQCAGAACVAIRGATGAAAAEAAEGGNNGP